MTRRVWGFIAAACLIGIMACGHRAMGYSYYLVGGSPIVWPNGVAARYLSPSTFAPGSAPADVILDAMEQWSTQPATQFGYAYALLDQDYPIDHFDGFSDTAAVPSSQLDPGVLGVTYLVNDGAEWFDADIVFSSNPLNIGYNFLAAPPCNVLAYPTAGTGFSFPLVVLHELGHALGLGHDPQGNESPGSAWFVGTMNPRYPSGGTLGQDHAIELHTDDRNGVRFLYPHSGPSGDSRVDLALAEFGSGPTVGKALPLSAMPSNVYPGEELVARSFIENLGTTHEFFIAQGFYLSVDDSIEPTDTPLGTLLWDIAFGDALEFDVATDVPSDIAAGTYWFGSIIDAHDTVAEADETNNAVTYCDPITVLQMAPQFEPLDDAIIPCGQPFASVPPTVTHPLNMAPITWSLDNPQPGMSVNANTGVMMWDHPIPSPFLYTIRLRATNSAGSMVQTVFIGVPRSAPLIAPMPDVTISTCDASFTGPPPQLTDPACMEPILGWFLDSAPPGMTINPSTGVVSWNNTLPADQPYAIVIRAINASGANTASFGLSVLRGDASGDGVVDLVDVSYLVFCRTGPGISATVFCECNDLDLDSDIDLADYSFLMTAISR